MVLVVSPSHMIKDLCSQLHTVESTLSSSLLLCTFQLFHFYFTSLYPFDSNLLCSIWKHCQFLIVATLYGFHLQINGLPSHLFLYRFLRSDSILIVLNTVRLCKSLSSIF